MAKFALGQVLATRGVADLMAQKLRFGIHVSDSLRRYVNGDWGDLCEEDKHSNDEAVELGDGRILAAYEHPECEGWKIWIITEADRSVTTVLFPDEY